MKSLGIVAGLGVLASLGGCGQKGPLYLPDHNAQVVTRGAAASSTSASSSSASEVSSSSSSTAAPGATPNAGR